jgi:hypothetical protein
VIVPVCQPLNTCLVRRAGSKSAIRTIRSGWAARNSSTASGKAILMFPCGPTALEPANLHSASLFRTFNTHATLTRPDYVRLSAMPKKTMGRPNEERKVRELLAKLQVLKAAQKKAAAYGKNCLGVLISLSHPVVTLTFAAFWSAWLKRNC